MGSSPTRPTVRSCCSRLSDLGKLWPIGRDFTVHASAVNTRWCGDITDVATGEGWLYLATVVDIASRRVVGHGLADHLRTELPAAALANAVAARDPPPGVIFHADRGCQYTYPSRRPQRRHGLHRLVQRQPASLGTGLQAARRIRSRQQAGEADPRGLTSPRGGSGRAHFSRRLPDVIVSDVVPRRNRSAC